MAVAKLIPMMFQKAPVFRRQAISSLRENMFQKSASYSQSAPGNDEAEMRDLLKKKFPRAKSISVRDISGGCGAMFEVSVTSAEFQGLTLLQRHRLVNEALDEKIKNIHGLTISTKTP